jgi:hypothetical protein
MLDREAWRSRIKMILAAKKVDFSKEKIVKLGAIKLEMLLLFSIIKLNS